jgi:hypothetical protein
MDKREELRTRARILVKIDGKSGILNNYSPKGMQISANSPPARKSVEISFNVSGQDFTLQGSIQWVHKRYAGQNSYQFGCRLLEPPLIYDTLLLCL